MNIFLFQKLYDFIVFCTMQNYQHLEKENLLVLMILKIDVLFKGFMSKFAMRFCSNLIDFLKIYIFWTRKNFIILLFEKLRPFSTIWTRKFFKKGCFQNRNFQFLKPRPFFRLLSSFTVIFLPIPSKFL